MLTFKRLSGKAGAFKAMTGLSVAEFQALLEQVRPRYETVVRRRRERADRKRAPGGGVHSPRDVTERLLMTMVWLRLYLTCEAVGVLFDVDKSTVSRATRPILLILQDLGMATLGWPLEARTLAAGAEQPPVGPPDGAAADPGAPDAEATGADEGTVALPGTAGCPDQVAIIDATEQRIERSHDYATQKAHYSGKKKAHTRKTQLIVNERGRIRHVSASVPGATHDLTLLRQSGVGAQMPPDVTRMGDGGYRGMQDDFPEASVALPYRAKPGQKLLPEEKLHNHLIARVRVVIENTLAEMKHFQILADIFRHAAERYDGIITAIAGIVNRRIDARLAQPATA